MPQNPVPPSAESERIIPFQGIRNFRDYGGYRVRDGGRVRRGRLFRSAQYGEATPEDLVRLSEVGLGAIVDLRGGDERAARPSPRPPGFAGRLFQVEENTGRLLGPLLAEAHARPEGFDPVWLMREGYAAMPFRWRLKGVLRNHFEALATCDAPVLVHCMAGKDRTGLAVALLHALLGVHRDDIVADYLLTNAAGTADTEGPVAASSLRTTFGEGLTDEQVRELGLVRPEYIEAALSAVAARHGGIEAYLTDAIGIPADWIGTLRETLIE